jgi:hypothetical protein
MDENTERTLLRRRLLGFGPACDLISDADVGRDLRLAPDADGALDLAMVEGIDNLGQALAIAVTTPLGGDPFATGFGFDGLNAMAEETHPVLIRERLRVSLVQVLRRDPRVRRVVDVKLEDDRLTPATTGSRTLDVRLVFEAISGDQAAVDLAGGTHG